jgi:hypothetical protein
VTRACFVAGAEIRALANGGAPAWLKKTTAATVTAVQRLNHPFTLSTPYARWKLDPLFFSFSAIPAYFDVSALPE